jgi:two-component system sensor histidine kinase SenX3
VVGLLAAQRSRRGRTLDLPGSEPDLPNGATDVLSVIGRAYILVDEVDGVVRANPSAYAYGLIRGHSLVHPELVSLVRKVRLDGVIEEQVLDLPRGPVGEGAIVVHVRVAPLGGDHVLLMADDRTEFARTAAMRDDFVANVSHELKTPVGAVSLLAEAIDEAADDPEAVRHFSGSLEREARRLSALVQDIIELSRLQGADVVMQGQRVDLADVIGEAIDRVELQAEQKSVRITVGGDAHALVFGDRGLLMTACKNLIDNAIRHSPDGTSVGVGLRTKDGLVSVTVTDQGLGIAEEDQERVFERFYRVDPARSRATGGTGLGLSIVRHVASSHGGEVTLWSQPGRGSTFTIRLPQYEEPLEAALAGQPATRGEAVPNGAIRQDDVAHENLTDSGENTGNAGKERKNR